MLLPFLLVCYALTPPVLAGDEWDDFYNNFATDLTPLLSLFGEQVTKQFLSESTSILDNIIFAAAPLGILTAVVSVIRVCGSPSLRAFIGRAQEGKGVAEVELCSSTSNEVCELWQRGGIARVFGRPKLLEIIYDKTKGDFYDFSGFHSKAHLFTSREYFRQKRADTGPHQQPKDDESEMTVIDGHHLERRENSFAPCPNLSLNIGIKQPSLFTLQMAALFGCAIQLSVFGFAIWVTYVAKLRKEDKSIPPWAFPLASIGTILLVLGMFLCAWIIETTTMEKVFKNENKVRMHWLQQGNQTIGDQIFDAFAHSGYLDQYMTSWKVEGPNNQPREWLVWAAVGSASIGFILQFIGLRGLHSFVALFQLGATILMAIVRAGLRSQRLGEEKNELRNADFTITGHELDWFAHRIESDSRPQRSAMGQWTVQSAVPICSSGGFKVDRVQDEGLYGVFTRKESDTLASVMEWRCELESEGQPSDNGPHLAARIMQYRARLARLTSEQALGASEEWSVEVRQYAQRLKIALEDTAKIIFSGNIQLKKDWRNVSAIFWSIGVAAGSSSEGLRPIHITIRRVNHAWRVNASELEAILGLWIWSIKKGINSRFSNLDKFVAKAGSPAEVERIIIDLVTWVSSSLRLDLQWECANPEPNSVVGDAKIPPVLSVPLLIRRRILSDAASSHSHNANCSAKVLYVSTRYGLPLLCAQDIFTSFISRVVNAIEDISDFEPIRETDGEAFSSQGTSRSFRLVNPHLDSIAEAFRNAELGTREDVLMCMIPILRAHSLLAIPDKIKSAALKLAVERRRSDDYTSSEDMFRWVYNGLDEKAVLEKELIAKELGELYRRALRRNTAQQRAFGYNGVLQVLNSFEGSDLIEQIKQTYIWTTLQFSIILNDEEAGKSLTEKLKGNPVEGLDNMSLSSAFDHEPFYPIGLVIAAKWVKEVCSPNHGLSEPPLCLAAKRGCEELIEDLITLGLDPNIPNSKGCTPIFLAAQGGHYNAVRCLLDYRATLSSNAVGKTPLWIAAAEGHSAVVQLLLEHGANPEQRDSNGGTPLSAAAVGQREEVVRILLENNVDIQAKSIEGDTALMAAATADSETLLDFLLDSGADIHAKDHKGHTALSYAIFAGKTKNVSLLVKRGSDIEDRNTIGWTGLLAAVGMSTPSRSVLRFLIDKGADIEAKDNQARTPLMLAVEHNRPVEVVRVLLEGGADVNITNGKKHTPLDRAVIDQHEELARVLLEFGADTECIGNIKKTPLWQATLNGDTRMARLLLEHGANPNYRRETMLLARAIADDQYFIMMMLVEKGGTVDLSTEVDKQSLVLPVRNQYEEFLKLLLPNCKGLHDLGNQAAFVLETAVITGNERILQMLIDHGVQATTAFEFRPSETIESETVESNEQDDEQDDEQEGHSDTDDDRPRGRSDGPTYDPQDSQPTKPF